MEIYNKYILDKINDDDYYNFKKIHLQLKNTLDFNNEKFLDILKTSKNNDDLYICIREKQNNNIVALGKFFYDNKLGNNKGFIDDIVVDKNHQNRHLGTFLVNYLLKHAKTKNCYICNIITNNDTKPFYSKLGFKNNRIIMSMLI